MTKKQHGLTVLIMAIPISDKSDEHLIDEIAQGNQASFRVLVMRYLQPGYEFVQRMQEGTSGSDKIVQAVFLKIWEDAPRWEATTRFKTWFYRLLIKACTQSRYSSVTKDEKNDDIKVALRSLSRKERTTLILYYYQAYTPVQIARILNTSQNTIEKMLYQARKKLHHKFNQLLLDTLKSFHEYTKF